MNIEVVRNRNASEISEYWHFRIFDGAANNELFVMNFLFGHLEGWNLAIPAVF